jgi:hypothetical protein
MTALHRWVSLLRMAEPVPIRGLFEAHLTVAT